MIPDKKLISIKDFYAKPGKKINLKDFSTKYTGKALNKKDAEALLDSGRKQLAEIQDKFYAHNKYSVLDYFSGDGCGR